MVETLDLLAFGAHPDDVEIGMGGTIAVHTQKGFRVGIVDLTAAELSSNGSVPLRKEEAAKAGEILKLTRRDNLGFPDRGLYLDENKIATLVDIIRRYRPKVVFAPYSKDRHPDHGHCGRLVEEAVFSAGIHKYKGKEAFPAHKTAALYFYFINGFHKPDVVLDITAVQPQKMRALAAYESQFEQGEGVETPLTTGYLETVESRDRLFGKESGVLFAEGFKAKRPPVVPLFI